MKFDPLVHRQLNCRPELQTITDWALRMTCLGVPLLAPTSHERVRHLKMIEDSRNNKVHHILHGLGMMVKTGVGRQDDSAAL